MNRRRVLVATTGALAGVAGCLVREPTAETDTPDDREEINTGNERTTPTNSSGRGESIEPPSTDYECTTHADMTALDRTSLASGPAEPPAHPHELSLDCVAEYVRLFEQAHMYNLLHCRDLQSITVEAETVLARETDHAVYAFGVAFGSVGCGTGEESTVGHHGPEPYPYIVGEDFLARIDSVDEKVRGRDEAYGSDDFDTDAVGLLVTNYDDSAQTLDVTITHRGELAYEDTLELSSRSSLHVTSVSAVNGEHEITVETAGGKRSTGTWQANPARFHDRVIRVLASGEPAVESLDPRREISL